MYPTKPLWEICEKITDWTHQTPTYFEKWIIFLSSKNVTTWKIDWENVKYIDENQHIEISKRITPKKWDILLAKNGTTGVGAIVDKDEIFDIYVSLALLRPTEKIFSKFLWYFINSSLARKQFNSRLKWSWVPNLHLKEIKEVKIPLPPLLIQQKIVKKLDKIFEKIDKNIEITKKNIANIEEENNSLLEGIFSECEKEFGVEKIEKILDKDFSIWKIPVKEYLKEWILPIIDQWKNFIWWYANDDSQKYNWKLPVLVYWDHTNSVKFIDFDFVWWADGIKIFKFCEGIDTKYMFYIINYYKPENLWYRRHFSILKQIQIPLPPLPIQQKIVEKLDKIFSVNSELKNFYEKNLKNLEELKQSILKQAFEDENFIK